MLLPARQFLSSVIIEVHSALIFMLSHLRLLACDSLSAGFFTFILVYFVMQLVLSRFIYFVAKRFKGALASGNFEAVTTRLQYCIQQEKCN